MKNKIIMTGVKPTGTIHIGNYFGSFKPSTIAANASSAESYLCIVDYHALTTLKNAKLLSQYVREVACTWLACGLDVKKSVLYRQSDVPQIFELSTVLSNYTAKGLLNRAHAYKTIVQNATEAGKDPDHDVNVGLYNYPILMAADILAFDTDFVPVGADQKQHIEIASDIAKSFNAHHGNILVEPQPLIKKEQATIPGLDGRKMSKSYGNQIPLFAPSNELLKHIKRITTDSSLPTEPKSTDCVLFQLYELFANEAEVTDMKKRFADGIGWGDVKTELHRVADRELAPLREKYNYYMENYGEVEKILLAGASRARDRAQKTITRVRKSIGA